MLAFGALLLTAHESPSGDIDPSVRFVDGRFHVYFRPNQTGPSEPQGTHFKNVYDHEGKILHHRVEYLERELIAPRARRAWEVFGRAYDYQRIGDVEYGLGETTVLGTHLWIKQGSDKRLVAFDWPKGFHSQGGAVCGDTVCYLASKGDRQLWLLVFSLNGHKPIQQLNLGPCATIWGIPISSRLLTVDDRVYVAWCGASNSLLPQRHSILLSSYSPAGRDEKMLTIAPVIDSNTHVAMARGKNRLMIAWHDDKRRSAPPPYLRPRVIADWQTWIFTQVVEIEAR